MRFHLLAAATSIVASAAAAAPVLAPPAPLAAELQQFVRVPAGHLALTHVRVIDGTGAAPVENATVLIDGAKIAAVQPPSGAIPRSEERRVGKECRSRGSPYH